MAPAPDTPADPDAIARAAAADAGVEVVDVDDPAGCGAVSRLFDDVWGREPGAGSMIAGELLVAIAHAGGQVTAARRGDDVVGATVAFLGSDHDGGSLHLHSHITGVTPGDQGRGVGWALKQHQRAWALARGVDEVRWTFDPLVRRNAVFNLSRLGARAVAYRRDAYGRMADERNRGAPTDRLVASWRLGERRVVAAAAGRAPAPDVDNLRRAGAVEALADDDGRPRRIEAGDAPRALVRAPADIERLRREDPAAAAAWSAAIRETLGAMLAAGGVVNGITRDGWYVITRSGGAEELR